MENVNQMNEEWNNILGLGILGVTYPTPCVTRKCSYCKSLCKAKTSKWSKGGKVKPSWNGIQDGTWTTLSVKRVITGIDGTKRIEKKFVSGHIKFDNRGWALHYTDGKGKESRMAVGEAEVRKETGEQMKMRMNDVPKL